MVSWNLIQIDSRLKLLCIISIQIGSWLKKLSKVLIQINSGPKRLSRILFKIDWRLNKSGISIRINHRLTYTITIEVRSHCIGLGMTFFGLSRCMRLGVTFSGWDFNSSVFPRTWFESTHDSSSISDSWIDSTHDSSGFPGNWLRMNSRFKWIPRYWFRSTHDLSYFQEIDSESTHDSSGSPCIDSNRLMSQAKKNDFESTHDSTLCGDSILCGSYHRACAAAGGLVSSGRVLFVGAAY